MKGYGTYIILICSLAVLIIGIFWGRGIFNVVMALHLGKVQVDTGQKYMASLTDQDIQVWIQRTQKYLKEDKPRDFTTDARPVPLELKKLKILMIDEAPNEIDYLWMGGMGHTELEVQRMSDGSFEVTARYSDENSRVIWPKTTNTAP